MFQISFSFFSQRSAGLICGGGKRRKKTDNGSVFGLSVEKSVCPQLLSACRLRFQPPAKNVHTSDNYFHYLKKIKRGSFVTCRSASNQKQADTKAFVCRFE